MSKKFSHPFIPNSQPDIKKQMLDELGMTSAEDIFKEIPDHLRFKGKLDLPEPMESEYELRRHVKGLLSKNSNCEDNISFLGGGTWQHYVPSVCDTIASRDEFLTAYVWQISSSFRISKHDSRTGRHGLFGYTYIRLGECDWNIMPHGVQKNR